MCCRLLQPISKVGRGGVELIGDHHLLGPSGGGWAPPILSKYSHQIGDDFLDRQGVKIPLNLC